MAVAKWHALLVEQIPMASAVADELSRQLVRQARELAHVALDDGRHALMPPDEGFTVQYRSIGGATIASVEGDLLGPDAQAYPAVLAWRSTTGADPRLTPDRRADDLEFFWEEFPAAEMAHPARIDAGDLVTPGRFRFDVDAEIYTLPDIWMELAARTAFTAAQVQDVLASINAAIEAWNRRRDTRVHYRGDADVPADQHTIAMHIDLGSGGLDALTEILAAVSDSAAGPAVRRCRIGHR